jgi:hypothetical protein
LRDNRTKTLRDLNMKNKILSTALFVSMVCSASAQAFEVEQSSVKPKLDCPDVKLLRHATKEQRKLTLVGKSPGEEPFFLSEHYCFVYIRPLTTDNTIQNATYTSDQVYYFIKDYRAVYRQLRSDEQKMAFIHLYVQALSQRALVYPDAHGNLVNISVSFKLDDGSSLGFHHNLIERDDDHRLMLDKLADIQSNPPTEKDNPVLMALVLQVLDVKQRLSAESAQDQLMESKWH